MAGAKYKHFYQLMIEKNQDLFTAFTQIHENYSTQPDQWRDTFNSVGRDVLDVIRDWERRLCSGTERGGFSQYSANLSAKFWQEIKKDMPLIDQVGVQVKKKGE